MMLFVKIVSLRIICLIVLGVLGGLGWVCLSIYYV